MLCSLDHDDVLKWKHFRRYWPFMKSPVTSPHKGQWCKALMFSLVCTWTNRWANNQDAGDFRRHSTHFDVNVMQNYAQQMFSSLLFAFMSISVGFKSSLMCWSIQTLNVQTVFVIIKLKLWSYDTTFLYEFRVMTSRALGKLIQSRSCSLLPDPYCTILLLCMIFKFNS